MKILQEVPIQSILDHQASVRFCRRPTGLPILGLTNPHWSKLSAYRVELEAKDADELYLYWENHQFMVGAKPAGTPGYEPQYTPPHLDRNHPKLVAELHGRHNGKPKDLRELQGLEPVLLSVGTAGMPLTVTDGNHRIIFQYLHYTLDGMNAFLCVHPDLGMDRKDQWFITDRAHEFAQKRLEARPH